MTEKTPNWLEQAERIATCPLPLAPYWDGQTFADALNVAVRELPSEAEKAALYDSLFALIDGNDPEVQDHALSRLANAFSLEASEENELAEGVLPQSRLETIIAAVERRLPMRPDLLEDFCIHFTWPRIRETAHEQIQNWLNRLDRSLEPCAVPESALLAARIFYGAYGNTWAEAGDRLLAALDHENETVRACAAHQIGKFCSRLAPDTAKHSGWDRDMEADKIATHGMTPLTYYWALIRTKEIQRAGVAGAFWRSAPRWTVDADAWLLTLLEQAAPEPYIRYFPCNLGFDAHERYSRNPAAIRRLMDAGRIDIALEAATEEREPVKGLETVLMELGSSENPGIVCRASWKLAYCYNRVHPNGERLGFVQRHLARTDCDLLLLFMGDKNSSIPHAAVLYPKHPRPYWSLKEAQVLLERVFPPAARGSMHEDSFPLPGHAWYQRGFVTFSAARTRRRSSCVSRITIDYRSDVYWNPISPQAGAISSPAHTEN